MTSRQLRAWRHCLAIASLLAAPAFATETFDTGAGNLLALLRESPGANRPDESLQPIGNVRAMLADGREVEISASWFHYLGDMHVRLVFDGKDSMQTASPEDLDRLRLSPEQALQTAVDNMRRRYGSPRAQALSGGLVQVTGGAADLVSSYFLDRAFWLDQLREHPEGLVVAVPRRGGLLFASAGDEAAVLNLRFSTAAYYTASERSRISSALYLFKDGRWSVYQPPQQMAQAR